MKITNLTADTLYLGFIEPHGAKLLGNSSIEVADMYATHQSMKTLIDDGTILVTGFNVDDSYSGNIHNPIDWVTAAEFNSIVQGLYVIPNTWAKIGVVQASATPASITGSAAGPFNCAVRYVLKIKFDGLYSVAVELPKGQLDIAVLVGALNGDAEFTKYGIAANDGTGKIKITSRGVGVNSSVEVEAHPNSAEEQVFLASPTVVAGTLTVATVSIPTHNPVGGGLAGISHDIKLYTTDIGGGSVVSSEFHIQRVSKGEVISGLYTPEATIKTDAAGEIEFEVAAAGAITEAQDWVGVVVPSTHYLASIPTSRLQVV